MFLVLVAAINVGQVVFDMMMAPLEHSEHMEREAKTTAEIARGREQGIKNQRRRRDITEAVIKGAPASLRRDLYFYFMEGSWTRVFVAFAFLFVLGNVFFAALYALEPGAVTGGSSFADAFFFSVQTMGTIGYGVLSPATPLANAIVTAQSALSLIGLAIVTGLVFAKASRPRASVLFSNVLVTTTLRGKRILMLRVGNARGNEVVDASLSLTVLKDEISPEGHHLRRLHDLKLVRPRTPMFTLTWTVMHEIDDDSPLSGADLDDPEQNLMFVATLMGHDGTYNQTIYARRMYYAESIRGDHHFVDVLHQLADGRMMVDYDKFHHTLPDEPAVAPTSGK
jgi:inward rectifier potassium channel